MPNFVVFLVDNLGYRGEANNLAAAMPERVEQLRNRLHAWYQAVDAQFLQEKDGQVPWKPEGSK